MNAPHRDLPALLSLLYVFSIFLFLLFVVEVQNILDASVTRIEPMPVIQITWKSERRFEVPSRAVPQLCSLGSTERVMGDTTRQPHQMTIPVCVFSLINVKTAVLESSCMYSVSSLSSLKSDEPRIMTVQDASCLYQPLITHSMPSICN